MEIDLSNKCRVCLAEDEGKRNIFEEFDDGITLLEILSSTTNFEISKEDGLSHFMCQNCTNIVVDFYNFKRIYTENERQIKALLLTSIDAIKDDCDSEETFTKDEKIEENDPEEDSKDWMNFKIEVYSDDSEDEEIAEYIAVIKDEEESSSEDVPITDDISVKQDCPHCHQCFENSNDIEDHLRTIHHVQTCRCKFCDKIFESQTHLQSHMKLCHRTNICDVCGSTFTRKSDLFEHMDVHRVDKIHVCEFCNRAFQRKTVLVRHRRIHTNPLAAICEICGRSFNTKSSLKTHTLLRHINPRNLPCNVCEFRFSRQADLERHTRRHRENRVQEFQCEQCPMKYINKTSLSRHILEKHSEGVYVKPTCHLCKIEFSSAGTLSRHKKKGHCKNQNKANFTKSGDNSLELYL